jgi:hypothetical protein
MNSSNRFINFFGDTLKEKQHVFWRSCKKALNVSNDDLKQLKITIERIINRNK